jgi:hypothetical protein
MLEEIREKPLYKKPSDNISKIKRPEIGDLIKQIDDLLKKPPPKDTCIC